MASGKHGDLSTSSLPFAICTVLLFDLLTSSAHDFLFPSPLPRKVKWKDRGGRGEDATTNKSAHTWTEFILETILVFKKFKVILKLMTASLLNMVMKSIVTAQHGKEER